jgi:hypothetical protein
MESKLTIINLRRVSDPRRAFRPAFRVTWISDIIHMSTMAVILITWEQIRALPTWLQGPTTSQDGLSTHLEGLTTAQECLTTTFEGLTTTLEGPTTSLEEPMTSLGAPPIAEELSAKYNIFIRNAAGPAESHSNYLSFSDS